MITIILSTLLPVIVSLVLGFVAAWHHDFNAKDATILNRMVLAYAVPLSVFLGTVSTTRTELVESIPLAIAILVGIVGMYAVVYLLSRFVFRLSVGTSALAALTASGPAVPFYGPAILGGLFGEAGAAVPVAVASIVINVSIVPVTIFLLTLESSRKPVPLGASANPAAEASANSVLLERLVETIKKPLVWLPILGFVLVLLNVRVPALVAHSLLLLGRSSAGVALFASGIVLAGYRIRLDVYTVLLVLLKNVGQPALVLGGLLFLGFGRPVVPHAVVATAIPAMPIVVMLALDYKVGEQYAPSILLISTVGSLVTVGGFIALTMWVK